MTNSAGLDAALHVMSDTDTNQADLYHKGALSHGSGTEQQRLQLMENVLDPVSTGIFEQLSIQPSWQCLEVGAGNGSVARWLAARCLDGNVVATDTDTRYLESTAAPNLQIRQHDAARDDFPEGSFDLIHARAVVVHLPDREANVAKMVSWLKPGGWLVLEEPATFPSDDSPHEDFQRLMLAFEQLMWKTQKTDNRWWPRRLPTALAEMDLTDMGMSVTSHIVGDGSSTDEFWRVFLAQVGPSLIQHGLVTEAEYEAGMAAFDDPHFLDVNHAWVAAWGRRRMPT